ncbi:DUF547 domain-containing protein [Putridiphycobacter roseus]|uniref:DUF547 domain-containing protein n=1 Tax=Putridiphycobacter roseus TaxID=2219161 RepID=A0A2W1ND60_9FLAO|nr:DUF547 domain-containing protein [Putridiphycobacter roseus]PZE17355.1 DUF547 domain-containing protein [Putridiphycobacter roseus]
MCSLNALSEKLLLAVKMIQPTESIVADLAHASSDQLYGLKTDAQKLAFWVNIYNAFYQLRIHDKGVVREKVFHLKKIEIAGKKYSLDQIEHGILRRGKNKYTAGLFPIPFQYLALKSLRPTKLDHRIHFTLNCGVVSCPPIAFYNADQLDVQLDLATESYLSTSTKKDDLLQKVIVSRLFLWFYYDFGRKKGIKSILKKHQFSVPSSYKIVFSPYNRDQDLLNFRE